MNDHLPNDDEEFVGLTRQQIADRMERDEWYEHAVMLVANMAQWRGDEDRQEYGAVQKELLDHLRARPAVEPADEWPTKEQAFDPSFRERFNREHAAPVVEQEPVGYMSPEDVEYLRDSIVQYRGRNYNIKSTIFLDSGLSATVPLYTHPAEVSQDRQDAIEEADLLREGMLRRIIGLGGETGGSDE